MSREDIFACIICILWVGGIYALARHHQAECEARGFQFARVVGVGYRCVKVEV